MLYKLTTQDNKTRKGHYNETTWGEGVSHFGTGEGNLCGPGWIHAYTSPLLAVLMNPVHANIGNPKLWEAEGEVVLSDRGLKVGCRTLTTVREIPLPEVTITQRIAFAILCTKEVCKDAAWNAWANKWLSGEDRSEKSALRAAKDAFYIRNSTACDSAYGAAIPFACYYYTPRIALLVSIIPIISFITIAEKAMEY